MPSTHTELPFSQETFHNFKMSSTQKSLRVSPQQTDARVPSVSASHQVLTKAFFKAPSDVHLQEKDIRTDFLKLNLYVPLIHYYQHIIILFTRVTNICFHTVCSSH